ncbi:molybdopterin-dependent oxidoreductase [Kitasatospora sp. NPDC002040]|uniref:molybdopterin-dependent oxidoreductase n=1 Tax=Kitasatospora sp. NPDC002040 TaxID=3154661 RepID=UPI00331C98E2
MRRSAAVLFHGELEAPVELTVAQLRELPSHSVRVGFDCLGSGRQEHSFEGPRLWDVLRSTGPQVDLTGRKQRLRHLLTVTGADGHLAVVSWAEIDPDFGGQSILLATSIDGTPLDGPGPQLVVPADACGARYISGITAVWLGAVTCPVGGAAAGEVAVGG